MPRIFSVSGKNAPYMHVYARICSVYAPYMQKKAPYMLNNAPYMLRICKKMPRICSVYAKNAPYMLRNVRIWKKNAPYYARVYGKNAPYMHVYARICSVYAPYMLRIFLSITQWKKRIEPEPKKMHLMLACSLRCSSIPKRWGQRTSKFPHVCFEAVTTAIHYLLSWKAFQKDACEIKIAHFLFAQPQPKTFRLRLPQKFPHISIEAVTTAIYVVCCHEKISKVCFWSKDCTFSYEAFTSATCGNILSWKVFQRSVGEKNDPFSFDTLYIQTYPGHRNEVRDIRASNWQWASTSSCTMGGFQMVEEMEIQPVLGEEEMEVETRWRRRRRRRWRWWRWRWSGSFCLVGFQNRISQRRMGPAGGKENGWRNKRGRENRAYFESKLYQYHGPFRSRYSLPENWSWKGEGKRLGVWSFCGAFLFEKRKKTKQFSWMIF